MKAKLRSFRLVFFILVMVQLLFLVAFGVFYFTNLFGIKDIITLPVLYVIAAIFIVINIIFTWIAMSIFSKLRKNSDLKAADLIGSDIQEAYNFGLIGLVIVDENNIVIWTNDLFKERQIDILDENILEWQPALKDFATSSSEHVVKVEINSRHYEVKYLSNAGLYIFKDNTEYENVYDFSKRQATVVGIIMIDNYSDLSGTTDDSNDIISKIRNAI
ncbi:hypothetical protein, partial [Pseudobutyrivibrio sp.]